MINRGGEKISAAEIKNPILAHSSVFNVAIDPVVPRQFLSPYPEPSHLKDVRHENEDI
jgi:hypothetical protein